MRRTFVLASLAALAAACSYDWEEFAASDGGPAAGGEAGTPAGEGGVVIDASVPADDGATPNDGAAPTDAGADVVKDAGCTPSPTCLADAGACGTACGKTSATCISNCGNKANCKNQCRSDERACRAACAATCVSCTQAAGCVAVNACDASAQQ